MTNGFESFRTIMGEGVHYTFNWFYVDNPEHRLPALVPVPPARARRRSVHADLGDRTVGLAGIHPAIGTADGI